MGKIKHFFRQNFPDATRFGVIAWLVIIAGGSLLGLFIAYFSYRQGLDMGDGSTFFSFAHNLVHGESIYKDFVHFRTPGSYFLQALFITIFGDQPASVNFALQFESHVLFTFFFGIALALFVRFKHIAIGILSILFTVMLPPYVQLRTALALVAVVLYIQAYRTLGRKTAWLIASGIFVGLAFIFGQEAALMAVVTIGLMEIVQAKKHGLAVATKRVGLLTFGGLIGALPLLIYVFVHSNISTFLYYVFYYAFILQPQGMNLVYPPFSHTNLIFYIVFAMYIIVFAVIYCSKKLGIIEGILLVFGVMRLITLLGRSDIGHLLFVLPEVFFLSLYAIAHIKDAIFGYINTRRFALYGLAFAISLYIAIHTSSSMLIVSAIIIYAALYFRQPLQKSEKLIRDAPIIAASSAVAVVAVFLYILYPILSSTRDSISIHGLSKVQIGGVNVPPGVYQEVTGVSDAIMAHKPTTLFSYPIQPYYYILAPKHATRFMTFEPQTTSKEEDEAIEDLKRTQPEVILYDPVQADSLSKPLGKINAYIKNNYKVERILTYSRTYWIMVPNNK